MDRWQPVRPPPAVSVQVRPRLLRPGEGEDHRDVDAGPPVGGDRTGDQRPVAGDVDRVYHLGRHRSEGGGPVSRPMGDPDGLRGFAEAGLSRDLGSLGALVTIWADRRFALTTGQRAAGRGGADFARGDALLGRVRVAEPRDPPGGLRAMDGGDAGRHPFLTRLAGLRQWQGKKYPAQWPAIIDTDTHERLAKLLADRPRRAQVTGKRGTCCCPG
jgi:hypothetical protein